MLFFDFGETVRDCPCAVCGREDRLIREGAYAALADCRQSLIKTVVVKETKDDHCGWKFGTVIAAFGGRDVLHAREHA